VSSVNPRLNGWAGVATYKKIATETQKALKNNTLCNFYWYQRPWNKSDSYRIRVTIVL